MVVQGKELCSILSVSVWVYNGRVAREPQKAHTVGAYPSFCSMKQLRVLLLPTGWDASPSQGYPQQYVASIHQNQENQRYRYFILTSALGTMQFSVPTAFLSSVTLAIKINSA